MNFSLTIPQKDGEDFRSGDLVVFFFKFFEGVDVGLNLLSFSWGFRENLEQVSGLPRLK